MFSFFEDSTELFSIKYLGSTLSASFSEVESKASLKISAAISSGVASTPTPSQYETNVTLFKIIESFVKSTLEGLK